MDVMKDNKSLMIIEYWLHVKEISLIARIKILLCYFTSAS